MEVSQTETQRNSNLTTLVGQRLLCAPKTEVTWGWGFLDCFWECCVVYRTREFPCQNPISVSKYVLEQLFQINPLILLFILCFSLRSKWTSVTDYFFDHPALPKFPNTNLRARVKKKLCRDASAVAHCRDCSLINERSAHSTVNHPK